MVVDALSRKNRGMLTTIAVQEGYIMEDLNDYKLTFVEPVE